MTIQAICKYTPIELFAGFGEQCTFLQDAPASLEQAESVSHANLCGFGKAVLELALAGNARQMVLVNCCDVMRRVHDVLQAQDTCETLLFMDLPHGCGPCQIDSFAAMLRKIRDRYAQETGTSFDLKACQQAFETPTPEQGPYVALLGARTGSIIEEEARKVFGYPVRNLTCVGNRVLDMPAQALATDDEDEFFHAYAHALLAQVPCMRMNDSSGRRALLEDPNLVGIVYHTMKFCDFYGVEYADITARAHVPLCKIESDFTAQSAGQLSTRIEAFGETLAGPAGFSAARRASQQEEHAMSSTNNGNATNAAKRYVAGIDSGSTSTDVVILDAAGNVVASVIVPTGAGASKSSEACLAQALTQAGIERADVARVVATGYGRDYIGSGDESITEITCHAIGAHRLDPSVRTVIDIGGQDSKVISLDDEGRVVNFVMNDKCAAGTGRFLEMMARALQMPLDEMASLGLSWHENIVISSTCSVFAESEVVSLIAQDKDVADIVHGLDESVAAKTVSLVKRAKAQGPYMMTGGVAANAGVVAAIERRLGEKLVVSEHAQLCGALGAAVIAQGSVSVGT